MAGTCVPVRGRPPATLWRRGPVGSGRARSPTRCPPTMRIAPRCASPREPGCAATPFESIGFRARHARGTMSTALPHRKSPAERERGLAMLGQVRDMCHHLRLYSAVPTLDLYTARERARRGDRDAALPQLREAVDK